MSQRTQSACGILAFAMLCAATHAQTSKVQSVALTARVAPIARMEVDQAAANTRQFTIVPISTNEIEISLDPGANSGEFSVPVMLSSNTKSYTLQAWSDIAGAGEIAVKNAGEADAPIFGRPRTLAGSVTFAMGMASPMRASRALVQIRLGKDLRERLKIRLKIQPLSIE